MSKVTRTTRILLIILVLLAIATAIYWFQPDVFSSISRLNPFGNSKETSPVTASTSFMQQPRDNTKISSEQTDSISTNVINNDKKQEEEIEELTPLEKEIRQRHESYQTKVYTYIPYQPPVLRNPFQRMVSTVYLEDEEERVANELSSEEDIRRFVQPELPPGSKFTGLISSGEDRLAILEIDDETYIVKEGDLILDKFLIKAIWEDTVIIDINGHEIPLQLGGGEATDE